MIFLFRLLLTFNATSLIIVVYLVKEHYLIGEFIPSFSFAYSEIISYIVYAGIPLFLTSLSLKLSKYLDSDSIESDGHSPINEIEQANNAFLPSYLGYFFVALSVSDFTTLGFIYFVLFVFTFLSQALYFNPLYLVFGYQFYNITTDTNVKIFIISKRVIKNPSNLEFLKLKRINNFTFIDQEV
ncbi:hypothetical protein M4D81_06055 [Paenibacillus sp. p3-SID867]|uniref:hypothetical protein n=1 Tax=Paenibacillus sp. p3-SID867 TaxID=2916363 RepID=UPI0021A51085|nr:hypothetical protein [Paenibacillus sp. p3-SID867]MCT1398568.1 hypothetical protein [Paenibacillus sp. p3-SID867]